VNWENFIPIFTSVRPCAFFDEIPEVRRIRELDARSAETVTEESSSLRQRLTDLPAAERARALVEVVRAQAAVVLGHPSAADVDVTRALRELGFDSLGAVDMRNRLNGVTGLRLSVTLVYDHPTVRALAEHVDAQLFPDRVEADVDQEQVWFRGILDRLSMQRLREVGLLDTLAALATADSGDVAAAQTTGTARIDDLDVADLVRMAHDSEESPTGL